MCDGCTAVTTRFAVSEVLPGLARVETTWAGRRIAVHVCLSEDAILVDCGFPETAETCVVPALRSLGVTPRQLRWLVLTHASADHHGGTAAMLRWAPNVTVLAHELDAAAIGDHAVYAAQHVEVLRAAGFPVSPVELQDAGFLALQGPKCPSAHARTAARCSNWGRGVALPSSMRPAIRPATSCCSSSRKPRSLREMRSWARRCRTLPAGRSCRPTTLTSISTWPP